MKKISGREVQPEIDVPKWPKFHYDEAQGSIRLTGQYRSPRFFQAWDSLCGFAALFGWMPFIALVATLYPTREKLLAACEAAPGLKVVPCSRTVPYNVGEFTAQDFFIWLGIWLVLVLVANLWCQYRLFRSKLDIELNGDHLRIGRKHYALDRIRSIDWDMHEEANNPERGRRERNFYARCYQVVMLYGARTVEIAAFRKDKKKAESLTLMLATALEAARSGARAAASTAHKPAPARARTTPAGAAVELPR